MKIINGYRVEKCPYTGKWIAFKKVGTSAWAQVKTTKKYKEIKEWAAAQGNKR